jgi:membrane-associated phospholipid phosphatase
MRRIRASVVLVTLLTALCFAATKPRFIQPADVDWESILSAPPADDSTEHGEEIATVLHWQNKRTAEDVFRCREEATADGFIFAEVLGDWFDARTLPVTADLLNQTSIDAKAITLTAKEKWNRRRPYEADSEIHPCVEEDSSPAYPSGHAVRGIVWASVLSQIFPERRDQLMALGRRIGDDRVIAGIHWPSDIEAGQKLGAAIAGKLLDNVDFKIELQRAREECLLATQAIVQ